MLTDSITDPIWISDTESDSDPDPDSTSANYPSNKNTVPASAQALDSGTTSRSRCLATGSNNYDNNKDNDIVRRRSVSGQASELHQTPKVLTDNMNHASRKGLHEAEEEIFDVFAEDDGRDSNTPPKQPRESPVSGRNSTPNTKAFEPHNSQRAAQFAEPDPTVATP